MEASLVMYSYQEACNGEGSAPKITSRVEKKFQ